MAKNLFILKHNIYTYVIKLVFSVKYIASTQVLVA